MNTVYKEALDHIERGTPAVIETVITGDSGTVSGGMTKRIANIAINSEVDACSCIKVEAKSDGTNTVYREPVFPAERLIILGGGHIAVPVCEFAAKLGFSVTVCDDRPDFANTQRFPLAAAVVCDSFRNAIDSLHITGYDYVVIITRGHRQDADCLRAIFFITSTSTKNNGHQSRLVLYLS